MRNSLENLLSDHVRASNCISHGKHGKFDFISPAQSAEYVQSELVVRGLRLYTIYQRLPRPAPPAGRASYSRLKWQ